MNQQTMNTLMILFIIILAIVLITGRFTITEKHIEREIDNTQLITASCIELIESYNICHSFVSYEREIECNTRYIPFIDKRCD